MEKDPWRELPGIPASLLSEAFLGTVPGTCHFSPWGLREIHQFPGQSGFPLPTGGRRRRRSCCCLTVWFITLLISTLHTGEFQREFSSLGCWWGEGAQTISDQNPHTFSFPQCPTSSINSCKIMTFTIILQPFLLKQGVIFNMKWPQRARGRWLSSGWVYMGTTAFLTLISLKASSENFCSNQ